MIYFGVAVIALMVGIFIGAGIIGYIHKCNHQWEEIINERSLVAREHYVVFMCKKCGKIKMTGVPYFG